MLLERLEKLPRIYKRMIFNVADQVSFVSALLLSYWMRTAEIRIFEPEFVSGTVVTMVLTGVVGYFLFRVLDLYASINRFLSARSILTMAFGCICMTAFGATLLEVTGVWMPKSIPAIYFLALFCFIVMPRVLAANLLQRLLSGIGQRIVVYGAGSTGQQLMSVCAFSTEFIPVAIVDDKKELVGTSLNGIRVCHSDHLEKIVEKLRPRKIVVAISNMSSTRRSEIVQRLTCLNVEVLFAPPIGEMVKGFSLADGLESIRIEDLLGRPAVASNGNLMLRCIQNKSVLVTGSGGSIGSELCRQILSQQPNVLVLFEQSEFALYQIFSELKKRPEYLAGGLEIVPVLGNAQDRNQVFDACTAHRVSTVYHTAAYKHVPLVENNIVAGVKNNVLGTYFTALACLQAKVNTFVLVSTDKAVRPTNVMGASKRLAELCVQALANHYRDSNTRLCMVRFGNVLGSSGSVVPLFLEQIKRKTSVTVTHPEVTRYLMSIPEAAQLVIQSGALAQGGDVFALDMGKPIKILQLAKTMIRLLGMSVKQPSSSRADSADGVEISFTGLRPGEKLYEELFLGDNLEVTEHPLISRAYEESLPLGRILEVIDEISKMRAADDEKMIEEVLLQLPLKFIRDMKTTTKEKNAFNEARVTKEMPQLKPPCSELILEQFH